MVRVSQILIMSFYFVLLQASGSEDDGDREQKIRFEGEDHPETEKHDKLRRRDTPHYLKGKRIDLQSNNQDKVMEILAKAGNRDGDEGQNNTSVRTAFITIFFILTCS